MFHPIKEGKMRQKDIDLLIELGIKVKNKKQRQAN